MADVRTVRCMIALFVLLLCSCNQNDSRITSSNSFYTNHQNPLLTLKADFNTFKDGQIQLQSTSINDRLIFHFAQPFQTQALDFAGIQYLRLWIQGADFTSVHFNDGGFINVAGNPTGTLTVSKVERGVNRVVTLQGFDKNRQPIIGATLTGYYSSPSQPGMVTVHLKWRFSVVGRVLERLMLIQPAIVTKIDTTALQNVLDAMIYGSYPIGGKVYAIHPSRFDTNALADSLVASNGLLSDNPPSHWKPNDNLVPIVVRNALNAAFVQGATLQINDPASAPIAVAGGTDMGSFPNLTPGTWEIIAKISGTNGGVEKRGTVTIGQDGTFTVSPNTLLLPPVIKSLNSSSAALGQSITLDGDGFAAVPGNNIVKFNGMNAVVTGGSTTSLQVTVPNGIVNSSQISVETGGLTSNLALLGLSGLFTIAGNGTVGSANGSALNASFNAPGGIKLHANGDLYIVDENNACIRKLSNGVMAPFVGDCGNPALPPAVVDGTGAGAKFKKPGIPVFDQQGNMYLVDQHSNRIRKVTPEGVVTTIAGSGTTCCTPDGGLVGGWVDGPGLTAQFNNPLGLTIDTAGNLYVADIANHRIRKVTFNGLTWDVSTIAGTGPLNGSGCGNGGFVDGPALGTARLYTPVDLDFDTQGNLYFTEIGNNAIRRLTPTGQIETVVGTASGVGNLMCGEAGGGFKNGSKDIAAFKLPTGIMTDSVGNLYVNDGMNACIRKITPHGITSTIAGNCLTPGFLDGPAGNARIAFPLGLERDSTTGHLYVADSNNNRVRKLIPEPVLFTVSGSSDPTGDPFAGFGNFANGAGGTAQFKGPIGLALDANLNAYITDTENHCIRKVLPDGTTTTFVGVCNPTGATAGYADSPAPPQLNRPHMMTTGPDGNFYVADMFTHRIRKVTPGGVVSTYAGSGPSAGPGGLINGSLAVAQFHGPIAMVFDTGGNLYVSDHINHRIRKITPDGTVSTLAGSSVPGDPQPPTNAGGFANGPGATAEFKGPGGLAVDSSSNVYVADLYNHCIRKITPAGIVSTYAGTCTSPGFADGSLTVARFTGPAHLLYGSQGDLYVSEITGNRIRKISPNGIVSTVVGTGVAGLQDGPVSMGQLNGPIQMAWDLQGNLNIIERHNHRLRKVVF